MSERARESGLAGYPGSESVSVPPATVASVQENTVRLRSGRSIARSPSLLFRFFLFFFFPSLSVSPFSWRCSEGGRRLLRDIFRRFAYSSNSDE